MAKQHPSTHHLDVDWIYEHLDARQREQFGAELRAAWVDPAEIAPDPTCTPDATLAVMGVAKQFIEVVRTWHVCVVLGEDAEWREQSVESDREWAAALAGGTALRDAAKV